MMSWPGNDMTDEGNGVYSASIPDGATKVIFTKGDDSGKTPDLDLQAGKIYDNGWSEKTPDLDLQAGKIYDNGWSDYNG